MDDDARVMASVVVQRLMREQNLTQENLAQRAGVSQATVSRFVRGRGRPTVQSLARIVEALQMPWPEFLEQARIPEAEVAALDDPLVIKQLRLLLDAKASPLEMHEKAELRRSLDRLVRAYG